LASCQLTEQQKMMQQHQGCCPQEQQHLARMQQPLLILSWCGWDPLAGGEGRWPRDCGGCCQHAAGVQGLWGELWWLVEV
jgi:hypothetical protein